MHYSYVPLLSMKHVFFLSLLIFSIAAFSQDMKKFNLYKPEEKADTEIANALAEAKKSGKHLTKHNWS